MIDHSDLIRRADTLKKQAKREPDAGTRGHLIQMADTYTLISRRADPTPKLIRP